jgi:hypothetical protein
MRLIKSIVSGILFTKAIGFASKKEYEKAMKYLEWSDFILDNVYTHYLLRGHIYHVMREFQGCRMAMANAIGLIENRKSLNEDEKVYLILYATDLYNSSVLHDEIDCEYLERVTNYSINNVEQRLKDYFPVLSA